MKRLGRLDSRGCLRPLSPRSSVAVVPRAILGSRALSVASIVALMLGLTTASPWLGAAHALEREGAITLGEGERYARTAVIDPAGDFAYFGAGGKVVKVDLATFKRVAAITADEGDLVSAVMDPAGQFAYFGTSTGRVIKIDLATFTRVGAITFDATKGEIRARSAVIDPAGKFAYFGTQTYDYTPAHVIKIDLATFTRVGTITLEAGETGLSIAAIDPAGGFAYFGTSFGSRTDPARVIKIDLATFTRVGAITLLAGEDDLGSAVIDPAGDFAYFGTYAQRGKVIKIDLATFTRVGAITLEQGEGWLQSAVMDPTADFAYFGTFSLNAWVIKIDLATFTRVGAVDLPSSENYIMSAVMDPAGDFAYFGTSGNTSSPAHVIKVRLRGQAPPTTHQRSLSLNLNKHLVASGTVTVADGFNGCAQNVTVKISRKVSGVFKVISSAVTNLAGSFRKAIPDRPGTYRAKVAQGSAGGNDTCGAAVSPTKDTRTSCRMRLKERLPNGRRSFTSAPTC